MPLFRSSYFCSSYYDRLSSVILYTRNVQMMKAWKVGEPAVSGRRLHAQQTKGMVGLLVQFVPILLTISLTGGTAFAAGGPEAEEVVAPAGSDSANSGCWRDYLNLSPSEDSVGDGSNPPTAQSVRVSADEAGPSHRAHEGTPGFSRNMSMEMSLRGRIEALERVNSPFLPQDERGGFWRNVQGALGRAAGRSGYKVQLNLENEDLLLREEKDACFRVFTRLLAQSGDLEARINAESYLKALFHDWHNGLTRADHFPTNREELQFVRSIARSFAERGIQSPYIRGMLP